MRGLIRSSSSPRRGRNRSGIVAAASPAIVAYPSAVVGAPRMDLRNEFLRDDLTELGSLLTLREHLGRIVDQFPPFGPRPALLLIDLDGFAQINSIYGPSTGDE